MSSVLFVYHSGIPDSNSSGFLIQCQVLREKKATKNTVKKKH